MFCFDAVMLAETRLRAAARQATKGGIKTSQPQSARVSYPPTAEIRQELSLSETPCLQTYWQSPHLTSSSGGWPSTWAALKPRASNGQSPVTKDRDSHTKKRDNVFSTKDRDSHTKKRDNLGWQTPPGAYRHSGVSPEARLREPALTALATAMLFSAPRTEVVWDPPCNGTAASVLRRRLHGPVLPEGRCVQS
ncbi:hypothetical protein Bbelb_108850 [Branchiostoma belcheri]|nr:hypothetical protein Bbelb_108850 [Branchiostoma belcheri]